MGWLRLDFEGSTAPTLVQTEFEHEALCDKSGERLDGSLEVPKGKLPWTEGPQALAVFFVLVRVQWLEKPNAKSFVFDHPAAGTLYEALKKPSTEWMPAIFGYTSLKLPFVSKVLDKYQEQHQPRVELLFNTLKPEKCHVKWDRVDISDDREALQRLADTLTRLHFTAKSANPFTPRHGITTPVAFFDRQREQRTICDFVRTGQTCQIVGERRIGKTSLLLQLAREAPTWKKQGVVVASLDLMEDSCHTLTGWLRQVSEGFGWEPAVTTLSEFSERVVEMKGKGRQPVLCLDEFEELTQRREEFPSDFFKQLRASAQKGLAIITASRDLLSRLTDPTNHQVSPFYNISTPVMLERFTAKDASDFVVLRRDGVPAFTAEERDAILKFAGGHPLALQVACYRVLATKQNGEDVAAALARAEGDMKAYLPAWGASAP